MAHWSDDPFFFLCAVDADRGHMLPTTSMPSTGSRHCTHAHTLFKRIRAILTIPPTQQNKLKGVLDKLDDIQANQFQPAYAKHHRLAMGSPFCTVVAYPVRPSPSPAAGPVTFCAPTPLHCTASHHLSLWCSEPNLACWAGSLAFEDKVMLCRCAGKGKKRQ